MRQARLAAKADPRLHIFSTAQALGQAAAELVVRLAAQAVAERGRFMVALSGGSLPKLVAPALVAEPLRSRVDWSAWHVFWADERCVPFDDPDSNYHGAREYLFDQVDIPAEHIYPLDAALDPSAAAAAYQARLARVFQPAAGQLPGFDLILLGMGEDGHTASLFPHHALLAETERWVAPIFDSPKPPPARITLTLPIINQARQVAFVAAGAGKAEVLAQVLGPGDRTAELPARQVRPVHGDVHWFIDQAAALKLGL
jgi:6-phosphogluconolactonase